MIAITGAAGLIGSHLVRQLIKKNEAIITIDNYSTGREENLEGLKIKYKLFANLNTVDLSSILGGLPITAIYHLASIASPKDYFRNPVETSKTCFMATDNVLRFATKNNIPCVIASSSEVYGDAVSTPTAEGYKGLTPTMGESACYVEGKRNVEALCSAYHSQHRTKINIARIFNSYGEWSRADDGRVIPNFIVNALRNEPLVINGSGNTTRSYCYAGDTARGLIALMKDGGNSCQAFNIGMPVETTTMDLAETIIRLTNSKSKIKHGSKREYDPSRRCPDISKAKRLLNWFPRVILNDGLEQTIKYFEGVIKPK